MKRLALLGLVAVGLAGSVAAWFLSGPAAGAPVPVTAVVRQGVLEKNLVFEGQVEFGQVADLASPETARLIRADLQLGVRVEAGAVLIELAPDTARAETQAARIWLDKTYLSQLASLLAERAAAMERTGKAVAATSAKIL